MQPIAHRLTGKPSNITVIHHQSPQFIAARIVCYSVTCPCVVRVQAVRQGLTLYNQDKNDQVSVQSNKFYT